MLLCMLLMASLLHLGHCGFDPEVITGDIGGLELEFNGTIYFIAEKYRDFLEASFYCNRWGGKLATIPNQEVFDFLKYAMGIQYRDYDTYIVGIMGDEIQKALVELTALPEFYYNCTADPDLCKYAGAGPQDINDTVFDQTCIFMGNCNSTKYVDIDGNDVTFLPWIVNMEMYINMNQCVLMDVYDCNKKGNCLRTINTCSLVFDATNWLWINPGSCNPMKLGEHLDGCHYAEFYPDDCSDPQEWAFICEKPESECPTVMEAPSLEETDEDYWEDFFGLETYCGYSYVRVVVNECAKRYLDLRNIRLGVSFEPGEFCAAAFGNVVETRLGNGTCSAEGRVFGSRLIYTYYISGEFGEFLPPGPGDFISRATPMRTSFNCIYKRFKVAELNRNDRVQTYRRIRFQNHTGTISEITLEMGAFSDSGFTNDLASDPYPEVMANSPLYFQISTANDLVTLRAIACWVSLIPSPTMTNPQEILAENCSFSVDVSVISNNATNIQASFPAFVFTDSPLDPIYLHCTVQACPADTGCQGTDCPEAKRKRRSADTDNHQTLSVGPIQVIGGTGRHFFKDSFRTSQQQDKQERKNAICRQKQCAYECKALGDKAVCLCPPGKQIALDGKSCDEIDDKKYWNVWDEEAYEDKFTDGEAKREKIKMHKDLQLKAAVCTFIASLVLCIASFLVYNKSSE